MADGVSAHFQMNQDGGLGSEDADWSTCLPGLYKACFHAGPLGNGANWVATGAEVDCKPTGLLSISPSTIVAAPSQTGGQQMTAVNADAASSHDMIYFTHHLTSCHSSESETVERQYPSLTRTASFSMVQGSGLVSAAVDWGATAAEFTVGPSLAITTTPQDVDTTGFTFAFTVSGADSAADSPGNVYWMVSAESSRTALQIRTLEGQLGAGCGAIAAQTDAAGAQAVAVSCALAAGSIQYLWAAADSDGDGHMLHAATSGNGSEIYCGPVATISTTPHTISSVGFDFAFSLTGAGVWR